MKKIKTFQIRFNTHSTNECDRWRLIENGSEILVSDIVVDGHTYTTKDWIPELNEYKWHISCEGHCEIKNTVAYITTVKQESVLTVDLLLFLFFNTTTKTQKAEEIFNRFTDVNKVSVQGDITIDGEDYVILRQIENKFEIMAKCFRVRENAFNPQFTANTIPTTRQTTSTSTGSASTYNPTSNALFTNITASNSLSVYNNTYLGNHPSDKVVITGSVNISGSLLLNGQSITAISASSITFNTTIITSSYTIAVDDYFVGVNSNYAGIVVTLPPIATINNGKVYVIKDISGMADTNTIIVSASSGEQVDLEPFTTLDIEHVAISVYKDTTGWFIF